MKKTLYRLLNVLSDAVREVPFEVQFWDGEGARFGKGEAVFVLIFKTERAAKCILCSGALGFGEEYMVGNILVEGDFQQLLRLGFHSEFQNRKLSIRTRSSWLLQYLLSLNTSGLVINGKVVSVGKIPAENELLKWLDGK